MTDESLFDVIVGEVHTENLDRIEKALCLFESKLIRRFID